MTNREKALRKLVERRYNKKPTPNEITQFMNSEEGRRFMRNYGKSKPDETDSSE